MPDLFGESRTGHFWILFLQVHTFASWGGFIGFQISGAVISTSLARLYTLGVRNVVEKVT